MASEPQAQPAMNVVDAFYKFKAQAGQHRRPRITIRGLVYELYLTGPVTMAVSPIPRLEGAVVVVWTAGVDELHCHSVGGDAGVSSGGAVLAGDATGVVDFIAAVLRISRNVLDQYNTNRQPQRVH